MFFRNHKKYKDMTREERIDRYYKNADRHSKIALCIVLLNIPLFILAYLDKIVLFLKHLISYLH